MIAEIPPDGRCERSPGGMLVFGVTLAESLEVAPSFWRQGGTCVMYEKPMRTDTPHHSGDDRRRRAYLEKWPHARLRRGSFESLQISLNYKAEPNWLTYCKLQELADRVALELRNQGLNPRSRIDAD
jgi:hypothetical protein